MGKHAYLHFVYEDPDAPATRPESPTAGKNFRVDGIDYTFEFDGYLQQLRQAGAGSKGHRTSSRDQRFRSFSDIPSKDDLIWRALVKRERHAEAQRARQPEYCGPLLQRLLKRKERHFSGSTEGGGSSNSSSDVGGRSSRRRRRRRRTAEDLSDEEQSGHEHPVPGGPALPLTSAGYIGWRVATPDLSLEKWGTNKRKLPR